MMSTAESDEQEGVISEYVRAIRSLKKLAENIPEHERRASTEWKLWQYLERLYSDKNRTLKPYILLAGRAFEVGAGMLGEIKDCPDSLEYLRESTRPQKIREPEGLGNWRMDLLHRSGIFAPRVEPRPQTVLDSVKDHTPPLVEPPDTVKAPSEGHVDTGTKPPRKRKTWKVLAWPYMVQKTKEGRYATGKELYEALHECAGDDDSPFQVGPGDNRGKLVLRATSKTLALKTTQTAWPWLRLEAGLE
jgi:hypothetical protein